jgi:tRNAThr (cytosine32-N3)-methyltransferase
MTPFERARELIDAAHNADPARTPDGRAAELEYADRVEEWATRLVPNATPLLRLAARCQHLERWRVPRADFPMTKPGYHAWRTSLYRVQADRAHELLMEAGVSAQDADEAARWISKTELATNAGTQALEDAAVLVFLEHEIADFAATHSEYTAEKFTHILRRTWRKLSESGRAAALGLDLPDGIGELVLAAVEAEAASARKSG